MNVVGGTTDVTTYFVLRLTATGVEATALDITTLDLQYVRTGDVPSAKVDATALAATNTAHTDNKAIEIDATDAPGLYRVDWPDAAFAAGVREVILSVKAATVFTEHLRVSIDAPVDVKKWNTTAVPAEHTAGYPIVTVKDGTGTGEINTNAGAIALVDLVTTTTTVTNQHTVAAIATGVWQDSTAGDFTAASSIGKSLYTAGVVPGGSGGILISGTNSGTLVVGALTVSGATTLSGAVSLDSTLGVTGTTTFAAINTGAVGLGALSMTTLTASGAVAFQSTLGITGAITATNASNNLTLGTFTVTTNAIAWNANWDAEVQSEAEDAIVAHRLDELLNADSDIDGAAPPTVGSVFHELMSKTAGSFTFDQTTDSNEALRDRGDAAWTTATGFSTLDAAGVRTAVGLATANLDTQLSTIDDFLDTEIAAILAAVDTEVTAIKAKTDQLTFTVANSVDATASVSAASIRSAIGMASANLDTQLSAIAGYIDTEVAALVTYVSSTGVVVASHATAAKTEIAVAVLNATAASYNTAGTIGAKINSAGSAADPLENIVPGSYASGTAGAALGSIGSAQITTTSPVSVDGSVITIVQGDDYNSSDNRALDFTDADDAWPTLTGATITFYALGSTSFSKAGSILVATGSGKSVRLQLTAAETAAFGLGPYKFAMRAALVTSGRVVTLVLGDMRVLDNAA